MAGPDLSTLDARARVVEDVEQIGGEATGGAEAGLALGLLECSKRWLQGQDGVPDGLSERNRCAVRVDEFHVGAGPAEQVDEIAMAARWGAPVRSRTI